MQALPEGSFGRNWVKGEESLGGCGGDEVGVHPHVPENILNVLCHEVPNVVKA